MLHRPYRFYRFSNQLRKNKLAVLQAGEPPVIATANIGCQIHLQGQSQTPVRHWIELIADRLDNRLLVSQRKKSAGKK